MTRFEMEISGALGAAWKASAEREIEKLQEKADNGEIMVDANGAASWRSNGRAIPSDCVEKLSWTSLDFSIEATAAKRDEETAAFMENYRRNYTGPTAEERMEMEAAFGKGTTVVDIISGERIRL
ncbi:MAG: hypothetical protein IJ899_15745 [Blautia sp.]|nr:hypothetical protein [Blautia sp.]